MHLYLFRHADAEPSARSDSDRRLTEKGVAQAKAVGRFCLEHRLIPDLILTSPIQRAEQTAHLFAEEIGEPKIVLTAPFLACGMDPKTALEELAGYKEMRSVMLVGHEPDLGWLAATLLGTRFHGKIRIRKASLTVFELDGARPDSAELQFTLPAKLMNR